MCTPLPWSCFARGATKIFSDPRQGKFLTHLHPRSGGVWPSHWWARNQNSICISSPFKGYANQALLPFTTWSSLAPSALIPRTMGLGHVILVMFPRSTPKFRSQSLKGAMSLAHRDPHGQRFLLPAWPFQPPCLPAENCIQTRWVKRGFGPRQVL